MKESPLPKGVKPKGVENHWCKKKKKHSLDWCFKELFLKMNMVGACNLRTQETEDYSRFKDSLDHISKTLSLNKQAITK